MVFSPIIKQSPSDSKPLAWSKALMEFPEIDEFQRMISEKGHKDAILQCIIDSSEMLDHLLNHIHDLEKEVTALSEQNISLNVENAACKNRISDLRTKNSDYHQSNQQLSTLVVDLDDQITNLRKPLAPFEGCDYWEMPDPPRFGGDPAETGDWIIAMRTKLTGNAYFFRNEQEKMVYINSRLEANVQRHIALFIAEDLTFKFRHSDDMLDSIEIFYGNHLDRLVAVDALANFHQRNLPFQEFMTEFMGLISNVGYMDDRTRINSLAMKLSDEMYEIVIEQDMPTCFFDFVNSLFKIDANLRSANPRKSLGNPRNTTTHSSSSSTLLMSTSNSISHPSSNLPAFFSTPTPTHRL